MVNPVQAKPNKRQKGREANSERLESTKEKKNHQKGSICQKEKNPLKSGTTRTQFAAKGRASTLNRTHHKYIELSSIDRPTYPSKRFETSRL